MPFNFVKIEIVVTVFQKQKSAGKIDNSLQADALFYIITQIFFKRNDNFN